VGQTYAYNQIPVVEEWGVVNEIIAGYDHFFVLGGKKIAP